MPPYSRNIAPGSRCTARAHTLGSVRSLSAGFSVVTCWAPSFLVDAPSTRARDSACRGSNANRNWLYVSTIEMHRPIYETLLVLAQQRAGRRTDEEMALNIAYLLRRAAAYYPQSVAVEDGTTSLTLAGLLA